MESGNRRFSPERKEGRVGLSEDLLGVSGDSCGSAGEWSKFKENNDILFKHLIKKSVFFYFVFKL